jgi:hypothetical protein
MRPSGPAQLALAFLLAVAPSLAQEKKEAPPRPGEIPAHIQAASTFLLAWGKGDWSGAKAVAAEKVTVKMGDKTYVLDVAGRKAEAALVFPFKGISTVRVEGKVKGVTVEEIGVRVGEAEKRGKGALTLGEQAGKFLVTGVAVE